MENTFCHYHQQYHLITVLQNPKSSEMQCGLASWGLSFIGLKGANSLRKAALSKNIKV